LKAIKGIPHHGLGRGFKAGKEEIVGLLIALERFAAMDDEATNALLQKRLEKIPAELKGSHEKKILSAPETGRVPQLHIQVSNPSSVSAKLQARPVPVHLSERFAAQGILIVDPQALRPQDDAEVVAALRAALD